MHKSAPPVTDPFFRRVANCWPATLLKKTLSQWSTNLFKFTKEICKGNFHFFAHYLYEGNIPIDIYIYDAINVVLVSLLLLNRFHRLFCCVTIVHFEQVNSGWDTPCKIITTETQQTWVIIRVMKHRCNSQKNIHHKCFRGS